VQDGEGTDSALAISTTKVGIGTASPDAKLAVETDAGTYSLNTNDFSQVGLLIKSNTTEGSGNKGGSVAFTALTGAGGKHAAITAVQTDVDSNNVGLAFEVHQGGTSGDPLIEAMRIDRNGKVGIGTDSPSAVLHLDGDSSNLGGLLLGHAGGVGIDSLRLYIDANNKAHITRGASDKLTIDSAGKVGIGTTSPAKILTVQEEKDGENSVSAFSNNSSTANSPVGIELQTHEGESNRVRARIISGAEGSNAGYLSLHTRKDLGGGIASHDEKMRIKSDGTINLPSLSTYANDTAAGTGGLVAGDVYKTSAGELRIKV
jgi:hypothetical protein